MDDPQALAGEVKAFKGVDFNDLHHRLPAILQGREGRQLAGRSRRGHRVLQQGADGPAGRRQAEEAAAARRHQSCSTARASASPRCSSRRTAASGCRWPTFRTTCSKAFVAAEDKRFYQHKGVDERGLIRAFIGNIGAAGPAAGRLDHHPAGGQEPAGRRRRHLRAQDARDDRRLAASSGMLSQGGDPRALSQLDLSRPRRPGASRWRRAAISESPPRSSRSPKARCSPASPRGRTIFNPERHPDRARERLAYVLGRMQDDGVIAAAQPKDANGSLPQLVAYERPRRDYRLSFRRSGRARGESRSASTSSTAAAWSVRSTISPELQRAAELALQEGLARYEPIPAAHGSMGPETNLAEAIAKITADEMRSAQAGLAAGARSRAAAALRRALDAGGRARARRQEGRQWPAGRPGGRPHAAARRRTRRAQAADQRRGLCARHRASGKAARAPSCAFGPKVQGAAVVLENKTGAHPRDGRRLLLSAEPAQPRDAVAAPARLDAQAAHLSRGAAQGPAAEHARARYARDAAADPSRRTVQLGAPSIMADPTTRISGRRRTTAASGGGVTTLRRALENSKNLVTANLLDGGIDDPPEDSLDAGLRARAGSAAL